MTQADPPDSSFAYCRRATRRAGSSFAPAFRLLPPPQRAAMHALYAFMRATDDLADDAADPAKLARWRAGLTAALAGTYSHRGHAALHHTVRTFGIDPRHLFAVLNGVEADLAPVRFDSFADLYPYCFNVASAVGLACLPIWGCRDPAAAVPAEAAGIAFQLTNMLRDIGEDLARGRIYLPREDWERFVSPPESWPNMDAAFRAMMQFQAARAAEYYAAAEPLFALLPPPGRAVFGLMFGTYRRLLREIERRDFAVMHERVRVPRWRKAALFAAAWPVRWGLT